MLEQAIEHAKQKEEEYRKQMNKTMFGTTDYYYIHGKVVAYNDMVFSLTKMQSK